MITKKKPLGSKPRHSGLSQALYPPAKTWIPLSYTVRVLTTSRSHCTHTHNTSCDCRALSHHTHTQFMKMFDCTSGRLPVCHQPRQSVYVADSRYTQQRRQFQHDLHSIYLVAVYMAYAKMCVYTLTRTRTRTHIHTYCKIIVVSCRQLSVIVRVQETSL